MMFNTWRVNQSGHNNVRHYYIFLYLYCGCVGHMLIHWWANIKKLKPLELVQKIAVIDTKMGVSCLKCGHECVLSTVIGHCNVHRPDLVLTMETAKCCRCAWLSHAVHVEVWYRVEGWEWQYCMLSIVSTPVHLCVCWFIEWSVIPNIRNILHHLSATSF